MNIKAVLLLLAGIIAIALGCVALPRQAQSAAQGNRDELIKKADDLYKTGKYREAIEAFKRVLEREPNDDHATAYIAYSFNKLGDQTTARQWMKRRVEIPGQSPSIKAQMLTDMTLICWDEADLGIRKRQATTSEQAEVDDVASVQKLLVEGIDHVQKAIAIAPRSAKAFNLLNLLYRAGATVEPTRRNEWIAQADEALRKAIQLFESSAYQQESSDVFVVPMISVGARPGLGQGVKLGRATKVAGADIFKEANGASATVEVFVGRDGRVRLPRVIQGEGKLGQSALAAARQYEFEPTTFEGHSVQVIQVITFPDKRK